MGFSCFSFVVGVWGGVGVGRGERYLDFGLFPIRNQVLFVISFGAKRTNLIIFSLFSFILILKAPSHPFFKAYVVTLERFNLGNFDS